MKISNIIQNFIEETASNSLIEKIEPVVMLVSGIGLLICGILWIRVWKMKNKNNSFVSKSMGNAEDTCGILKKHKEDMQKEDRESMRMVSVSTSTKLVSKVHRPNRTIVEDLQATFKHPNFQNETNKNRSQAGINL